MIIRGYLSGAGRFRGGLVVKFVDEAWSLTAFKPPKGPNWLSLELFGAEIGP